MNKIFENKKEDISKAAIDFFSFGHLLSGYFVFIILKALFLVILGELITLLSLLALFLYGVIWEIVENTYLFKRNIKFGYRRDSFLNSSMDVVMLTMGGLIASIFLELNLETFLIVSALFFIGNILLMSIYANRIIELFSSLKNKK